MNTTANTGGPRDRNPLLRWVPWVVGLLVIALLFVVFRPSSDSSDDSATSSATTTPRTSAPTTCKERQLTGSSYGPCKAPKFTGNNGGATARGVTADTIKVTFRNANPAQLAALNAIAGPAMASLGGDQEGTTSDLKSLVAYFNQQFELYGRHVEVEVYEGQGQFLDEFQGKGVQGAQIDAASARDAGAFADVSFATMTQPYAEALAAESIIAMGPVYLSQSWYAQHAPYAFGGPWPVGTQVGEFTGNLSCAQLAGHPAAFAASDLASKKRVFGVLHPENPEYTKMAEAFEQALHHCGQTSKRTLSYALDIGTAQQDSVSAMAQMKAAGVTTVVCFCDEVLPVFLSKAADQQSYGPEWLVQRWPDPWGRLPSQDQWARAMQLGGTTQPLAKTEIGTVMNAATNGAGPASPDSVRQIYEQLLVFFSALQAAGPKLTPASFQAGMFELPDTKSGVFGPWHFGPKVYNPNTSFQLGWWSPKDKSALDGESGSVQNCNDGAWYSFDDPDSMTVHGSAPECFN